LNTGLVLIPQAVVLALMMPISGLVYDRFGARWPAYFGMLLTGSGILLLAGINVDSPRGAVMWSLVVMGAGLGLGMMPIMTGGLASLPSDVAGSGSAFSTLAQRVSAALGLAALTALITVERAQLMADRSGLVRGSAANADPWVVGMREQGPAGLIPMWQHLSLEVQTRAYSDAFLVAGSVTLLCAALAFLLPPGPPPRDAEKLMVH
jgi:MFS family permease